MGAAKFIGKKLAATGPGKKVAAAGEMAQTITNGVVSLRQQGRDPHHDNKGKLKPHVWARTSDKVEKGGKKFKRYKCILAHPEIVGKRCPEADLRPR